MVVATALPEPRHHSSNSRQLSLLVLLLLFCSTSWAESSSPFEPLYQVNAAPVNVRRGPVVQHPVVFQLLKGSQVQLLSRDEPWVEISLLADDSRKGWMHGRYLSRQKLESSVELPNQPTAAGAAQLAVVASQLHCVNLPDSQKLGGCLVYIDVALNGLANTDVGVVSCRADIALLAESGEEFEQRREKSLRTPLKEGSGAARLEMLVLAQPAGEVTSMKLLEHRCQLE